MTKMDMEQLLEIRRAASGRDVPVIKYLEEECGWASDRAISELGRVLRMPVLAMEGLRRARGSV